MTYERFPAVHDLWSIRYGQLLMIKLGLVSLALAWGAFHHFVVRPRLDRPGVAGRLSRSLLGEAAVALSILLLAAILVDSRPPEKPTPSRTAAVVQPR
jgi:copper transport protein